MQTDIAARVVSVEAIPVPTRNPYKEAVARYRAPRRLAHKKQKKTLAN